MINMLLGAPGGGKSYEAVAFHVLPALEKGRKVITNLPLLLENFTEEQRALIEIRTKTLAKPQQTDYGKAEDLFKRFGIPLRQKPFNPRAFSNVEDYGDPWRHPVDGYGPLYVIDECHLSLPRGRTPVAVAEWYSLHRHEFADCLLISQSYGKVDKDICDLVQTLYRVRKAVAFGFQSKYIRKVYDGLRGDCVNEGIRAYDKKFFKYYRSHTLSSGAGTEQGANDIVPIWRRWPVIGALTFISAGIGVFIYAGSANPLTVANEKKPVQAKKHVEPAKVAAPADAAPVAEAAQQPRQAVTVVAAVGGNSTVRGHPLQGYGIHVAGYLENATRGTYYLFVISQGGQPIYNMNQDEMLEAGYTVKHVNACIAALGFEGTEIVATCDFPRIGMAPGANFSKPPSGEAAPAAMPAASSSKVSADGYGVLGKQGPGVRQPEQSDAPVSFTPPAEPDQPRPRVSASSPWRAL